ncbi:LOW QUALITY PROTEIN: peroxidase [Drosophila sulfurigaster albostrigata]|uniref:LOW QUALITY PROTEIN: peroxidase n=1 Tax=Drosophila sulfurigaster albostrigata TaxID=89887 RepID=UPI002D21E1E1|nr:LOW QUALITY PROTEIN: peroxidase [Drosophila sulfurigaster albostrigata]
MRAFTTVFLGFFLLANSATSADKHPSLSLPSGCPYGHSSLELDNAHAHLESNVRQKRHSHPYDVRPGVGASVVSDQNLDALIKNFLPKYSGNNPEGISSSSGWLGEEKRDTEPVKCGIPPANCLNNTQNLHYRTIDGACNNLLYPDFGIAVSKYRRLLRPTFNEYGKIVPNARLLSLSLYGEKTRMDKFRTVAAMQWGQFVAHDISQMTTKGAPKDCCTEPENPQCMPIKLAPGGPIAHNTGKSCLSFARSVSEAQAICPKSGPYPEKLSVVTSYLDLSSLYGNSIEQNRKVRLFKGGLLRTSTAHGQHWLPVSQNEEGECGNHQECYVVPDQRNSFQPTIIVMQTVLLREHNRLAEQLALLNPHYNDERLYQEARKINIAQYQKISYYEWLVTALGSSYTHHNGLTFPYTDYGNDYVNDYDESVNPGPYAEFSQAAFRYSHTQIPGWFSLVAPNRYSNQTLRLSNFFDRPENMRLLSSNDNLADLVRGMITQLQKQSDANIDPEIKHFFDRKEFEDFGSDLKALDIQRGRDFGLPSYNDVRELCGLRRANYWDELSTEIPNDKIALLRKLYASPDDVELNVGGTVEFHLPESIFGPTMQCIIAKQFLNTRRGDRFFFEHENHLSGFSRSQLAEIRKVSAASLFCLNVQGLYEVQPNVFVFPNSRNVLLNCNDIPQVDISKWQDLTPQLVN